MNNMNVLILLMLLLTIIIIFILCMKLVTFFIKKNHFPKKLLIACLTGIISTTALFLYTQYFFSFADLKGEYYRGPLSSPQQTYTANAYFKTYGGAAGGVNVWVDITYNNENAKSKTVYYSDAKSKFFMEWKDEVTLYIQNEDPAYPASNRNIELKIDQEIYDEDGLACKSLLMKDEYTTCFQNE